MADANYHLAGLLVPFDGTNGATSAPDVGPDPKTLTFVGGAQLDTATKKFGTASLKLSGSGQYVTVPDNNAWWFGKNPFTIRGWFRFTSAPGNTMLVCQWGGAWAWYRESGQLFFRTSSIHDTTKYTWTPTLNQWYHLQVDRDEQGVIRQYIDGVMVTKDTGWSDDLSNSGSVLAIGSLTPGGFGGYDYPGYIDDLKLTNGKALCASDAGFTPPATPEETSGPKNAFFPAGALNNTSNNWGNLTLRQAISISNLIRGGSAVKIALRAASGSTVNVAKVYIGRAATDGSGLDFIGTPTQVLFGGSASVAIAAGTIVESDTVAYTIDATHDLIVAVYVSAGSTQNFVLGNISGNRASYYSGDVAATVSVGSGTALSNTVAINWISVDNNAVNLSSISPNHGVVGGGTAVTLTGTGFTGSTGVTFDGVAATSVVVVNDTTITCNTPAHAYATVDVIVQNPINDSTLAGGYTYDNPAATVTSVTPNFGPTAGGTSVTIVGTNFTPATDVKFDGTSATSIVIVDSTHITCDTPAHTSGAVNVVVYSPDGDGTLVSGYTFLDLEDRVTQAALIVLDASPQVTRVTQAPLIVLYKPLEGNRVTQAAAVVLFSPKPVPLPVPIVPEVPVTETWGWMTTIVPGIDGREQRFQLRDVPRYRQQFGALILDEEDRVEVYDLLMRYLKTEFVYPFYQYGVRLTAAATAGATKLFCNTTKTDLRDDEKIAVYDPRAETTILYQATTIDVDGVNLALPLEVDVPGNCQVCPAILFRIQPTVGFNMNSIDGDVTLSMESTTPRVFQRPGATPTFTTIDGTLIIPERNIVDDGIPENFDFGVTWFDNKIGKPGNLNNWRNPHAMGTRVYSFDRYTNKMDYWRGIFDQLKGKQGICLIPTFRNDLPLREPIALNATQFTSFNTNFFIWYLENNYRYLQIESANGIKYRKINSVEPHYGPDGFPDYITVKLASSIGNVIGDNDIKSISYLNLCRLDSDEVVLSHYEVDSEIKFEFKAVNQ